MRKRRKEHVQYLDLCCRTDIMMWDVSEQFNPNLHTCDHTAGAHKTGLPIQLRKQSKYKYASKLRESLSCVVHHLPTLHSLHSVRFIAGVCQLEAPSQSFSSLKKVTVVSPARLMWLRLGTRPWPVSPSSYTSCLQAKNPPPPRATSPPHRPPHRHDARSISSAYMQQSLSCANHEKKMTVSFLWRERGLTARHDSCRVRMKYLNRSVCSPYTYPDSSWPGISLSKPHTPSAK